MRYMAPKVTETARAPPITGSDAATRLPNTSTSTTSANGNA